MERREFLALSAAPLSVAAGLPPEATTTLAPKCKSAALPAKGKILERATKLTINIERCDGHLSGFVQLGGSVGACGDDRNERSESFSLIRELLAAFQSEPTACIFDEIARSHVPDDAQCVCPRCKPRRSRSAPAANHAESGTYLNIDLYRGDWLEGFFEIRRKFGLLRDQHAAPDALQRDEDESLALIRELLAAFERQPKL